MNRLAVIPAFLPLISLAVLSGCDGDTIAPPRAMLADVQIRAEPDAAPYRAGDSVRFTIADAEGASPARVEWAVLPGGQSGESVSGEFTHRFDLGGTFTVLVRAEFGDGRAGEAARKVEVERNLAPSVVVAGMYVPFYAPRDEELVLVAEATDPDDAAESLVVEWFENVAGEATMLATGDTLRITPSETGTLRFGVRATDPHGADALHQFAVTVFDNLSPVAWRRRSGLRALSITQLDEGIIAAHDGHRTERDVVTCGCTVAAFDRDGNALWTYETASAGAPLPAGHDGRLYLARGDLAALGADGGELWRGSESLVGATVHGGAVLPDGTLLLPVRYGADRYVRAVSPAGVPGPLSAVLPIEETAALIAEADGRSYVLGDGLNSFGVPAARVSALDASGVLLWTVATQRLFYDNRLLLAALAFGPDSLVLFSAGDSLTAVRQGETIWRVQLEPVVPRGTIAPLRIHAVSGTDGLIYTVAGTALRVLDPATGAIVREASLPAAATGMPALAANGMLYVPAGRRILGVDAATGAVTWQHETAGSVATLLLTADGLLVVGDAYGYMEAMEVGAGHSDGPWPMEFGGPHRRNVRGAS